MVFKKEDSMVFKKEDSMVFKKEDSMVFHHSSASAVDAISRALRDASTSKRTRRWLLERTALGAVGIAAAGVVVRAGEARTDDSVEAWGAFASTTEALTVTILTELVRRAGVNRVPSSVSAIFDGVYAAELDHWEFIHKLHRHDAVLDSGRLLRRRRRRPRPYSRRQGRRGRRASVREYLSPGSDDRRGGRAAATCPLRCGARRRRVRASRARAISRRRDPSERPRVRGLRIFNCRRYRGSRRKGRVRLWEAGNSRWTLLRLPPVSGTAARGDQREYPDIRPRARSPHTDKEGVSSTF